MPRFRIRASNGKEESIWDEEFRDEARLREVMPKRGWVNVLSVEQIADAPTPGTDAKDATAPIKVFPGQVRLDAEWAYLAPEVASQHPLYGIGGWAALLFALMALGLLLGVIAWVFVVFSGGISPEYLWLYPLALAFIAWQGFVTYQMLKEKESFPTSFLAFSAVGLLFGVAEIVLEGFGPSNGVYFAATVAWMAYVVQSRRINVTYRKRVERNDPFLQRLYPPPA